MKNSVCSKCGFPLSKPMELCPECGSSTTRSQQPAQPIPAAKSRFRRPYYQYGGALFVFPLAVHGVATALTSLLQAKFSMDTIHLGTGVCMVGGIVLMILGGIDRAVINPGLPAAPFKISAVWLIGLLVAAAVWLFIAAQIAGDEPPAQGNLHDLSSAPSAYSLLVYTHERT